MTVKTTQVVGRRRLRFETYEDVLDDVHKLAGGSCSQLGNWSLGQVCQHLASTMHMSIDGAKADFPWYMRTVARLLKKRFLTRPMKPGFTVPAGVRGLVLPGDQDTAAGVAELEKAVGRLRETSERKPHILFGKLTRDEWDQLHMRHSELHLSFIVPE